MLHFCQLICAAPSNAVKYVCNLDSCANPPRQEISRKKHCHVVVFYSAKKLVRLLFHMKESRWTYRWEQSPNALNCRQEFDTFSALLSLSYLFWSALLFFKLIIRSLFFYGRLRVPSSTNCISFFVSCCVFSAHSSDVIGLSSSLNLGRVSFHT